jgi:hypothetical protein
VSFVDHLDMTFRPKKLSLTRTVCLAGWVLLSACSEEQPPISVAQFMDNERLLEATMVRCAQNRAEMKYEAECINARDAVNRLAAREEQAQRQAMEAQSERKRQALRRTQEATAEARRRALEAQRQREENEYLGLFEDAPADNAQSQSPPPGSAALPDTRSTTETAVVPETNVAPAPTPETDESDPVASDLQAIREELRRRKQNQEQD